MMPCQEHPKYTGQRSPRSNCAECQKLYLSLHPNQENKIVPTKAKKEKETAVKVTNDRETESPEILKVGPRIPDRLLCLTANQYRSEIVDYVRKAFPRYIVHCNADANTIILEETDRHFKGMNTWKIEGSIPLVAANKKATILKSATKKAIQVGRGDVFFSETLNSPLVIISFNPTTKRVFFREWFTHELVNLSLAEFEKLELRDIIGDDDFDDKTKCELKVLTYK